MNRAHPPGWAELLLRLVLAPRDEHTVSGDLLEEYRERIRPQRGSRRADLWYVTQVFGFAWRATAMWALLLGAAFVARTALDWFVPTADFKVRANLLTMATAGVFFGVGAVSSWRGRSLRASALAGVVTALTTAAISIGAAGFMLAVRHDAATLLAIDRSGGLAEVFTLPMLLIAPAAALSLSGGVFGYALRMISSRPQLG
jgi:hypothetical protein